MKKHSFLIFSLIFLFFFILNSCTKDEQPLVKLDQDFLSYFAFPVGSWWKYKEIKTGERDSFYVNKYQIENFHDKEDSKYYELLSYQINTKTDTAYGWAKPFYTTITPNDSIKYRYIEIYKAGQARYLVDAVRFLYKIAPYQELPGAGYLYVKHIDTLTIQGNHYKDIYLTDNPFQADHNPIKSEYYCRNIGVIKREYFDGSVWELTNYHLNK